MLRAEQAAVNTSILGGFKIVLILGVGAFAFFQINPLSEKKVSGVEVAADSYPFVVPKAVKDGYIGENSQILSAKSQWEFRIKNDGDKDLTDIEFELPFSGSYCIQTADSDSQNGVNAFSRQIINFAPGQGRRCSRWS